MAAIMEACSLDRIRKQLKELAAAYLEVLHQMRSQTRQAVTINQLRVAVSLDHRMDHQLQARLLA